MDCLHCRKPVVLIPSAAARAAKDHTGKSPEYFTSLFPYHATCTLKLRAQSVSELMRRTRGELT